MATRTKKAAAPVAEVIERESTATLTHAPIRFCDLDHKSMRHRYCHRAQDALAFNDDKDTFMTRLVESLLSEGQQVPVEYYRDETGRAILIRGYQRCAALLHIIERGLDPERFGPEMMVSFRRACKK
ncbi:MAG: hypothetical protein ACM3NQ_12850 [Bacteroidales bacterium]